MSVIYNLVFFDVRSFYFTELQNILTVFMRIFFFIIEGFIFFLRRSIKNCGIDPI